MIYITRSLFGVAGGTQKLTGDMSNVMRRACVWLVAILVSTVVQAYSFKSGGVYYNSNSSSKTASVTKGDELYSGTVTIPATVTEGGVTYNVTSIEAEAFKSCIHLTAVNIGSNVATIGYRAFYGCEELEEIIIPNNVTTLVASYSDSETFMGCTALKKATLGSKLANMGKSAFRDCQNLTTVTILDGCTKIAESTFNGCTKLSQVVIPNSVTSIGSYAFLGCAALTKATIGEGVTAIGAEAFRDCIRLNDLSLGNNVRTIGYRAFFNCTSLEEVVLTDNIVTIVASYGDSETFMGCTKLETVTIGSKVAECGSGLFKNCTSLKNVTIKEGCTIIGAGCFAGCTKLAGLTIPSTVINIGNEAFSGCIALKQIAIPNSVLTIGSSAFSGCTALTKATIGDGVTSIGASAFYGCDHLSVATLGSEVRTIGYRAFANCSELEEIVLTNNVVTLVASYGDSETFMNCTNLSTVTLGKKLAEMGYGAFLNCTNLRTVNIVSGCSYIGKGCFKGCTKIANIDIPNTVENIGNEAFMGCIALKSITIPESVITIGDDAFHGCKAMTTATIGDGVTSIGLNAFNSCTKLTTVHLGDNVKTLGYRAFAYCTELTTINLTDYITTFGAYYGDSETFIDCKNLDNVVLGKRVSSMGKGVFMNCTGLKTATIHDGCELIGTTCFKDCIKLKAIDIPNSVLNINEQAFFNCKALQTATIGDGVTTIGPSAFQGCEHLTDLTLGEDLKTIGYRAFYNCISLTDVIIPDWVTTLVASYGDSETFSNCTALKSVTLGKRITSIGKSVFQGCPNLETVTAKMPEPVAVNANVFPLRQKEKLYVYPDSKDLYAAADVWKEFGNISVIGSEVASQTLTFTMPAKTYGDAAITLPAKTNEGLTLTWTSSNASVATISDNTLTIGNAGSATITAEQAGNSSYQPFSKTFTLTVDKAVLTVTANDCTKKQGEANPELTVSYNGFKNGDRAASLTTQPTATTTATTSSPVGTYPITASGGSSSNYTFTYVPGTLTVTSGTVTSDCRLYPVELTILTGNHETMSIQLDNQEPIIMFEFFMQLPDGLYIEKDNDGYYDATLNSDRTDRTHMLEVDKSNDGLYHFLCYSSKNKPFIGSTGELLTVNIGCEDGVSAGVYQGKIRNIIMSNQNKQQIEQPDYSFNIEVVDYMLGDVNGDKKINGMDVVELVSLIMDGGYSRAGDLYPAGKPDGKLNGMDLVEEVELVMSQTASARAMARLTDGQAASNALMLTENTAGTNVLGVKSDKQYILAQMTVELSGNMSLTDITSDGKHTVAYRQIEDNRYVVLCYSNRNLSFDSNEKILEFHSVGEGELIVSDVMLVDADKHDYYFSAVMSGNATGIRTMSIDNGQLTIGNYFDLQGRQVNSTPKKGVYIVNGQKTVVK